MEPGRTVIGNRVSVSYGCYFSMHGRRQEQHNTITIEDGAYLGMQVNVIASMDDVVIGRKAIVGAGSLVNRSIPANHVAVGVPAKIISDNAQPNLILDDD